MLDDFHCCGGVIFLDEGDPWLMVSPWGALPAAGPLGCGHLGGLGGVTFWRCPPSQPGSLDVFPWSVDAGAGPVQICFECREKCRQGFAACPMKNLKVVLLIILSPPTIQNMLYFSLKYTFPGW